MGDGSDQAPWPDFLPPQPQLPPSQEQVPGQVPYPQARQYPQPSVAQTARAPQVPRYPQRQFPQGPQMPPGQFPQPQTPPPQLAQPRISRAPGVASQEETAEGPSQLPRSQWRSAQYRHDTETLKKAGPGTFALIVGFVSGICGLLAAGITFVYTVHQGDPEATLEEIRETVITGGLVGAAIGFAASVALLVYGRR